MITLRPYQEVDVSLIRGAYAFHKRVLYVAPTGSGKTVLFTYIASQLVAKNRTAWILVHRQELLSQTSRALSQFGVDHGLISPQYSPNYRAPLQIASVQSLVRRLDRLGEPNLIIVDECQHAVSPTYQAILNARPNVPSLGVTATPARLDGRGLGEMFDHMIIGPTVADLTDDGYLARAKCYAPPQLVDMRGVKTALGDYAKEQAAARMDVPTITGDAVKHYERICNGAPAIAFCVSVLHAQHVAAQFRANGFRSASVDGKTDDRTRRGLIAALGTGEIQVLTSCDLISEGLDVPAVTGAILLRPTKSLALARQQIGRALRPAPGKSHAIILDHVGNLAMHGLPTEEIEWSLEGGKRKKPSEGGVTVRQCPACFACFAPAAVCPECGHEFVSEGRKIKQQDGELVEIDQIQRDREKAAAKKEVQRAKTYEELQEIGRKRGYKQGWAFNQWRVRQQYKERFGRRA